MGTHFSGNPVVRQFAKFNVLSLNLHTRALAENFPGGGGNGKND